MTLRFLCHLCSQPGILSPVCLPVVCVRAVGPVEGWVWVHTVCPRDFWRRG